MKRLSIPLLFALFLALLATLPAAAQDPVEPPRPIPLPPVWDMDNLRIAYQRVDVTIADQVATTHIDQLFVNEGSTLLEGIYLFPLPPGAAVSQLTMWVNGAPIEAKILAAEEARAIYDQIVRQLRDPALLEYVGTQAIQANVFPIPANEERRIEIAYSQVLPAENGLVRYLYPQSTNLYTNTPLDSQRIRVEVSSDEAIRAIYSPTHPVAIDRQGEFAAVASFEGEDVQADEDFELFYAVSPEEIGLNLLSFKEAGEDGFFLLLVAPTVEVDREAVVAKDVILVVDTSGSMQGEKLAQAKDAALFVIENLNPEDRFNIVAFSTGVSRYEDELVPAAAPGAFGQFVERLEAVGGTNISQALLEAAGQADPARPTTIIFLTDGLATEGVVETDLLLDAVRQATPDNVRLFAFGVGDDVDTTLLDSLARDHGSATTYVRPGQAIDEAVSGFYAKVSTPVLADIALDFGDIRVDRLYPAELPDLFAGTQLVLAGRYREGGAATVRLTGEVNGRALTFTYEDITFREAGGDDFIPRLWATRAIGNLLTEIRLRGENEELVQSVVDLSIRYGIITPYTSYLIEEEDIFSQTGREGLAEESMRAFEAPAEVSGATAVAAAAAQGDMAEAPMAALPIQTVTDPVSGAPVALRELVRTVGSKTFVLRDGVWIDTAFDAESQTPEEVGFASDAYFELLAAAPELGQYLALGPQVLVVYGGVAYQTVEGEGAAAITLPVVAQTDSEAGPAPEVTRPSGDEGEGEAQRAGRAFACTAALAAPLLLVGLAAIGAARRPRTGR